MGWGGLMDVFTRRREPVDAPIDPMDVALDATIADLRRVASDLNQTHVAWEKKLQRLKEERRA